MATFIEAMVSANEALQEIAKHPELAERLHEPVTEEQMRALEDYVEELTFELWFQKMRTSRGLSLSQLAEKAGVSRTHLWQVETGKSSPTVAFLRKVAAGMGCYLNVRFVEKQERS